MRDQPSGDRCIQKSLFISIALVSFIASAEAQTATEIWAKVSSVYAGCRTYSDEGVIYLDNKGTRVRQLNFRTSFVRPDRFRFQMLPMIEKPANANYKVFSSDSLTVWKNGDVIGGQGIPDGARHPNLRFDSALYRISARSAGSSINVPQLLLPEAFRSVHFFSLIVDPKVAGEEKINGRQSFRIDGTLVGFPISLWIDKNQYLVLKFYRRVNAEGESTVEYNPKLNADVPPEDLMPSKSPNQIFAETTDSKSVRLLPPVPKQILVVPPRLRDFGSSLSRAEKTGGTIARATDDEDVVRVETDLVLAAVLVLDAQGKIVRGLTQEDFIVKEDDKLQEVTTFSLGDNKDLPRSIVLIIDYSISQLPYIRTSIESAKILVDKLNPKDRMAVVTDDVKLLVDFTSDKQLLKTQLESLKTSALAGAVGVSEQYDALLASLNELFNNEDVRPIIIFQTDGDQLDFLKGSRIVDSYWPPRKYSLEDILTKTEKTRASVYSVISGIRFVDVPEDDLARRVKKDWEDRQHAQIDLQRVRGNPAPQTMPPFPEQRLANYAVRPQRQQTALVQVAKFTGTIPEFLEEPVQADEIYTRVLTDIDRRYVIGYYPTNRARDGKRRKISIQVRDHPEYTVWGQKSYFARKEE